MRDWIDDLLDPVSAGRPKGSITHAAIVLSEVGVNSVSDLCQKHGWDLLKIPNFGRKTLALVEDALDASGYELAGGRCTKRVAPVKPPRAPHPVFGPVPRGRVVLTVLGFAPEDAEAEKPRCFNVENIAWHEPSGNEAWPTRIMEGAGASWSYHEVKQTPAEVSRLIAEAQADE